MELVTPAIGLIFWTTVVFTMLVLLLKKFAWKPILTAVDQRNKSINESLQQAEKARAEMAEAASGSAVAAPDAAGPPGSLRRGKRGFL